MEAYVQELNYWWQTKEIAKNQIGIIRNKYLNNVLALTKIRRIIALAGIRRSGKSTIMFQIMNYLLHSKSITPNEIWYIKIDDLLEYNANLKLSKILELFEELTGKSYKSDKLFIFIDEIQYLENWDLQLKKLIDAKYPLKLFITSSSFVSLYDKASDSLAGRITFIPVFPLSFKEFLHFNNYHVDIQASIKDIFKQKLLTNVYYKLLPSKTKIKKLLSEYIEIGGFPEWFEIKDKKIWFKTIRDDYLGLILYKDIVKFFKIRDPILLENLVKETIIFSTERFSYNSLANRLGTDNETLKLYLKYLKSAFLIFTLEVFSKTKKAADKREKKILFWEEGLRTSFLYSNKNISKSIENIISTHLIHNGLSQYFYFKPYYWKDKYEVDFVYNDIHNNIILPVEIKYSDNIDNSDLKGLFLFNEKFKTKGIIVTKNIFKCDKKNIYLPAWFFLLLFE